MKRMIVALLISLFCFVPLSIFAAGPQIDAEQTDFNFGQIAQGEKVSHTFRFQNAGDEPLMVDRVRSSCGCTAALLSAKIVAAGDVAEIQTTFDSSRFNGAVKKTIYLYANDPHQPVTEFHIRGTVNPEILMTPHRLDIQDLVAGETREVVVRLTNQGTQPLQLSKLKTTTPVLAAELSAQKIPVGGEVSLHIRVTPKEGSKRLSGYVLMRTSSSHVPDLRFPVYGMVTTR
ncbi:MAG: DUF1573 domain-containing protein [Desulfuromonadaceae bacterium]